MYNNDRYLDQIDTKIIRYLLINNVIDLRRLSRPCYNNSHLIVSQDPAPPGINADKVLGNHKSFLNYANTNDHSFVGVDYQPQTPAPVQQHGKLLFYADCILLLIILRNHLSFTYYVGTLKTGKKPFLFHSLKTLFVR